MKPWRECGYCGATVREAYCSWTCQNSAQRLRDVEARHPTRSIHTGPLASAWEAAAREFRLRVVRRLVLAGCPADIAIDEAGFMSEEREVIYRALKRRGLRWPNIQMTHAVCRTTRSKGRE